MKNCNQKTKTEDLNQVANEKVSSSAQQICAIGENRANLIEKFLY